METKGKKIITVQTTVEGSIEKVWEHWISPEHIVKWNYASEDWHTPWAMNDVRAGGKFLSRMAAKDGSIGFDFEGVYTSVNTNEFIEYEIEDGRKVRIDFTNDGKVTKIIESFEAESQNSIEMQQQGWQSILDNFKKYTEAN